MSKKSLQARQIKIKKMVLKYKKKRYMIKKLKKYDDLQKLPRNSSPIRLRNICSISGRTKGYIRKFGISRIEFRKLSSEGLIPGIKKSSW